MITAKQLQNSYVNLYSGLRNYIWPITQVEDIANLEIETFTRFPDLTKLKLYLDKIDHNCTDLYNEDKQLSDAIIDFKDLVNSEETFYAKLDQRLDGGLK